MNTSTFPIFLHNHSMKDMLSLERLQKVQPLIRERAILFLEKLETMGLTPRVVQAYRSLAEQEALYAQGRTKKGNIVTNARGGESFHNYGLAIDIAFLKSDGSVDFNVSDEVASIGESFGFEWGGRWKKFPDRPHFQIIGNLTITGLTTSSNKDTMIENALKKLAFKEEKKKIEDWAKMAADKAKNKGVIINWSDPDGMLRDQDYQWIFYKLGVLDKVSENHLSRSRMAVILDRLHLLD